MKLTMRKYRDETDYWHIRQFLREIFLCNERREYSWPLYRWDYWRWHVNENIFRFDLRAAVFLWEAPDGRLAAVLNPEGRGEAFPQVHPDFRSADLEVEMISIAETQYASTLANRRQRLAVWSSAQDALRRDILQRRGYVQAGAAEYQRRRSLSGAVEARPADGYSVRVLGDADELPARSWLSWKAFHADEPDCAYEGWEWYRNVQRAPLYRRDLDFVAVAPTGELAAFCTLWFDDVTRTAAFEPVGTHPAHRRRGLATAVMTEGLRRARSLGATLATVNSGAGAAGALYASLGFTDYDLNEPWVKDW